MSVWIVIGVFVLIILALGFALYTRRGSDIANQPLEHSRSSPAAAGPGRPSGHVDEEAEDPVFDQRGKR